MLLLQVGVITPPGTISSSAQLSNRQVAVRKGNGDGELAVNGQIILGFLRI
jgi:hypothetical protein